MKEFKGSKSSAVGKAYHYYSMCMDETEVEGRGTQPVMQVGKAYHYYSLCMDETEVEGRGTQPVMQVSGSYLVNYSGVMFF